MDTNRWDLNIFCVTLPFSGWLCFTDPKDGKLAKKNEMPPVARDNFEMDNIVSGVWFV